MTRHLLKFFCLVALFTAAATTTTAQDYRYHGYNVGKLILAQVKAREFWDTIDTTANLPANLRFARRGLSEGDRLRRLDKGDEAIVAYREAIHADPIPLNINEPLLARSYLGQGLVWAWIPAQREKAIQALRQAVYLGQDKSDARLALAMTYCFVSQWANAAQTAEQAMKDNPDHPLVRFWIGFIYFHGLGDHQTAMNAYRDNLLRKPNDENALDEIGTLYFYAGDYPNALSHLQRAIRLSPKDADAYWFLGVTYLQMGNRVKAREVYQNLLRIHPDIAKEFAARL